MYTAAHDFWDDNWLGCIVTVSAHGFQGTAAVSLRTEEFESFLPQLERVCRPEECEAHFSTMEETVELRIQMSRSGTCHISGNVRMHAMADLWVSIQSDQSYLAKSLPELQSIVDRFPVRSRDAKR
jgi:hypothetical protein